MITRRMLAPFCTWGQTACVLSSEPRTFLTIRVQNGKQAASLYPPKHTHTYTKQQGSRYDGAEEFVVHAWGASNSSSVFTGIDFGWEGGSSKGRVICEQAEETRYWTVRMSQTNAKTQASAESWFSAHFHQLHQEHEGISWSLGQHKEALIQHLLHT